MGNHCCMKPSPTIEPTITCISELPFTSLYQKKLEMLEDKFLLEVEFNKTKDKKLSLFYFQQKLVCSNFIEHLRNAKDEKNEYFEKARKYLDIENIDDERRKEFFEMMGLDDKKVEAEWYETVQKRLMKTREF